MAGVARWTSHSEVSTLFGNVPKLAKIGGEELVQYLAGDGVDPIFNGFDSAFSSGKSDDSSHSSSPKCDDSERDESSHKDSTDSKDSTEKTTVIGGADRAPDDGRRSPYGLPPAAVADTEGRDGERTVVETRRGEETIAGEEDYTRFERWMIAVMGRKKPTERMREWFNAKGFKLAEDLAALFCLEG